MVTQKKMTKHKNTIAWHHTKQTFQMSSACSLPELIPSESEHDEEPCNAFKRRRHRAGIPPMPVTLVIRRLPPAVTSHHHRHSFPITFGALHFSPNNRCNRQIFGTTTTSGGIIVLQGQRAAEEFGET